MIDFALLRSIIESHNSFLLTTHVNPDGDAIGSEIAFAALLRKLNKQVTILNYSPTPLNLAFLDPEGIIQVFNKEKHSSLFDEADVIVALDFNVKDRVVKMQDLLTSSKALKICIDHHEDPDDTFDRLFVDTNYAATGHIIYEFITASKLVPIDYTFALPLYTAIMTDTGSFRFQKTTGEVLRIAAHLVDQGLVPYDIYDLVYERNSFNKLRLLGTALDSITLHGSNNELAVMTISLAERENLRAAEDETDGFVNFAMSINNVKIGLKFLELEEGFKVSLRSRGSIPVNKLAGDFDGGGHMNAAGIRIRDKNMDEMKPVIIKRALEYIDNPDETVS
jgi:phosphoesterase RecJ-like protein